MTAIESWLPWVVALFTVVSFVILSLPSVHRDSAAKDRFTARIQILVLGDIGRSPRMQYHALSIARHGASVDLVGYQESDVHPEILANASKIKVHALDPIPSYLKTGSNRLFLILGPLKVLFQIWTIWSVLGYRCQPSRWMLVQNPPSIPTLLVAEVICFLRRTRLVIDWHNFGYSILAMRLGISHPLVRISRLYEWVFARSASAHLCVTRAMARTLTKDYRITTPVQTLHDRPASDYQPLNKEGRLKFLESLPTLLSSHDAQKLKDYQRLVSGVIRGNSKLLVSSTSWTPDEDFSLLFKALVNYSNYATTTHPHLPELLVIITGKGPQKDAFCSQIRQLRAEDKLEMVTIETAFLSSGDYASLLGSADLGVSLHTSSSGVDLPMKVVDMFGAGLPIAGWGDFEAWPELVTDGTNGKSFSSASGLLAILVQLFGENEELLKHLKEGATMEGERRWDDEWNPIAGKLLELC